MVPKPRLCTLTKRGAADEFGFNLHAERGKGHFIGAVDDEGIADNAGLQAGQRLAGVNGQLIYPTTTHKEVLQLIKRDPLRAELLVASEDVDRWHVENDVPYAYEEHIVFEARDGDGYRGYAPPSPNEQRHKSGATADKNATAKALATAAAAAAGGKHTNRQANDHQHLHHEPMAPRPRLCTLNKQSHADEFGFNLHYERGKGHFIGAVDDGGIADRAGLETGQRIVGVNGQLIYPTTAHKEVVALIKTRALSSELLVASEDVDRWHAEQRQPFSYDSVIVYEPHRPPAVAAANNHHHQQQQPRQHRTSNGTSAAASAVASAGKSNEAFQPDSPGSGEQQRRHINGMSSNGGAGAKTDRLLTTYNDSGSGSDDAQPHDESPPPKALSKILISDDTHTTTIRVNQSPTGSASEGAPPAAALETADDLLELVFNTIQPPAADVEAEERAGNGSPEANVEESGKHVIASYTAPAVVTNPQPANGHAAVHSPAPPPASDGYYHSDEKPQPLVISPYSVSTDNGKHGRGTPDYVAQSRDFSSPSSTDTKSFTSTGSANIKDENRDIFKLTANEARQAMLRKKRDPRVQNAMSLEEKYRVISNL